jgi:N-acetylneuraminate synthase/N,N'-diacetyllegionaminate synthase
MNAINISGRLVGPGYPCFVIAEAGVNHNGSVKMAKELVDVAAEARADAVKFQTFLAEKVMTLDAPKAEYQKETTGSNESQIEMIKKLQLSFHDFNDIKIYCERKGIIFLSTPFDERSVDFLDELEVPAFKISSSEVTNHPFLESVAGKGKPIIMSTGMCYLSEVDEAVRVIKEAGCRDLILLHCVSNYPADPKDANIRAMQTMAKAFQLPVGYSDHTQGIEATLAAVSRGACVIEKHFTLDKNLPGPDHKISLNAWELKRLVESVRIVEISLGDGNKVPSRSEILNREILRRSLVASCDISRNSIITSNMLTALRPANGISPSLINLVVGNKAKRNLSAGQQISWGDLE